MDTRINSPPPPPLVALAVNVTGDPVASVTLAVAAWSPVVLPRVQTLVLTPLTSVWSESGERVPPSTVDQVTVTSVAGRPSRVTTTRNSLGSATLTGPIWWSPFFVAALSTTGDGVGPVSPP